LIRSYSVGQRRTFVLALGTLLFEAGTAVIEPIPLGYLIDYLTPGSSASLSLPSFLVFEMGSISVGELVIDLGTIAVLTLAILTIAMVNSAADSVTEILLARGGQTLGYQLRVAQFGHLQRLSLAYHDRKRTGDVITRVTGDVKEVEEFVTDSLSDIVGSIFLLVGTIIFIFKESWHVAALAVLIVPIMAFVSNYFATRIKSASKRQRAREGDVASTTQEMLTAVRVIQTFGRSGDGERAFAKQSSQAMNAAYETSRLEARFSWIVSVLQALTIGAVVWVGVWLIARGSLSVGILVVLVILIERMFKPTRKIIKQWNRVGKLYASTERIADVLDREATVKDLPGAKPASRLRGEVVFEDVSFSYQFDSEDARDVVVGGRRQEALSHVSFTASPGEVVALVGHSGAGKTSIAQLLPRLYDPDDGQVLIDGEDVRSFTLESLRSQISMVLQETVLFSGTVADNISYGRPGASRDEIVQASIRANAHEFVELMPDGYETQLSERATNLSGGQRQRIAIARAIIRGTPLLILDEPTTGLDAESTDSVLRGLRTLMRGKTTLLISHDLNLIRSADRILVLRAGKVAQSGSHSELMAEGGLYAYLYSKQFSEGEVPPTETPAAAVPTHQIEAGGRSAEGPELAPSDRYETGARASATTYERDLPGFGMAHDVDAVAALVSESLLANSAVTACEARQAIYLPGECLITRYEVVASDGSKRLVTVRWLRSRADATRYFEERISPLLRRAAGHPDAVGLAVPAALWGGDAAVAYAWPVDGDLPALVQATDPARITVVMEEALKSDVRAVTVSRGHYGRQHRCVLAYDVIGGAGRTRVFGKVAADGRGATAQAALEALRPWAAGRFAVPESLGYHPDMELLLLAALPGAPIVSKLLKTHLGAKGTAVPDLLQDAVAIAGGVLGRLHAAPVRLGLEKTVDAELDRVACGLDGMSRVAPGLAGHLGERLGEVRRRAASSTPSQRARLAHGDFSHTQLLFQGSEVALVDFDTVCMAEPGLDLGHFQAYLRLAVRKAKSIEGRDVAALEADLVARFMSAYADASEESVAMLRERAAIFEKVSLLRLGLHSWQKFKVSRLRTCLDLLEEGPACP
jgi:ABC-type multidrug transport system fused ATPase/permease subunit